MSATMQDEAPVDEQPEIVEPVAAPIVAAQLDSDQLAVAAIVIVAMSVIATAGFRTVFASDGFFVPAFAGAALGALVVVGGRRLRLLFGEIVGLGLVAPMIVGPIAVGGLGFYRGLVLGWSDVLSATPPIDATPALKALPFIAAFLGALVGTELFRIRELPGIGIVGPLTTLVLTALFSEQTRNTAVGVGLVLLVGLVALARLHYRSLSSTGVLVLGFVVAVVVGLASMISLLVPYADEDARFDLRELQESPWDPLALPSPLAELKASLKTAETGAGPILRISGDQPVARWRTASLPAYNGIFWGVSEPDAITEFVPIDTSLPAIEDEPLVGERLSFDVDVLAPIGAWVPTGGVPERLDFRDVTDARMSVQTGTIGVPNQMLPGNSYELEVVPWVELDEEGLREVVFQADQRSTELEVLPPLVRNLAADFSTGLDQLSGRRIMAIRDNLQLGSYTLRDQPPGHSFGRIAEFLQPVQGIGAARDENAFRALVAYEEVYAATGALLARLSDIPTRVAVGYVIPEDRWVDRSAEVFAADASAWIEVLVADQGWVPIDVSPNRSRQPEDVDQGVETQGVPIADPPQAPPQPEDDEEPEIEESEDLDEDEDEEDQQEDPPELTVRSVGRVATVAGVSSLMLMVLGLGAIAGAKRMRRRRRRDAEQPARRIAGAWAELRNRIDESGDYLPATATPREAASRARAIEGLDDPAMAAHVETLADQVSVAAFHPLPPSPEAADTAWASYDVLAARLRETAGPAERVRRVVDPRTLRDDDRVGTR